MNVTPLVLLSLSLLCGAARAAPVTVRLQTSAGDLDIEVDVDRAPQSAGDFLWFVDHGLYDRRPGEPARAGFYRTVRRENDHGQPRIEVIQGGVLDDAAPAPGGIAHETTRATGLRHLDGTVSLARGALGTGSSQAFFICLGAHPGLDFGAKRNADGQGFAAFGRVTAGLEVVRRIHAAATDPEAGNAYMRNQLLREPVVFERVFRVSPAAVPSKRELTLTPEALARLDGVFSADAGVDGQGSTFAVVSDGALRLLRGDGVADDAHIDDRTVFHLGSLSKHFTAAAVALLIAEGKLSLETPVADHLPQAKRFGFTLRVKHLVYSSSGLFDATAPERSTAATRCAQAFCADVTLERVLSSKSLQFRPGTRWAASNANAWVLAKIVERISGMPLPRFMHERIFEPLGMTDSRLVDDPTELISKGAEAPVGDRPLDAGVSRPNGLSPRFEGSGVISTTVADLTKWHAALSAPPHALGGEAFTKVLFSRTKLEHSMTTDAVGFAVTDRDGTPLQAFAGRDVGGSSYIGRLPTLNAAVICLSNDLGVDCEAKALEALEVLFSATH